MRSLSIISFLAILIVFQSCLNNWDTLESNDTMNKKLFYGYFTSISKRIYDYQIYYSLEQNKEVLSIPNESWDISFPSIYGNTEIRLNSANSLWIYPTNQTDLFYEKETIELNEWHYDASSGNTDSLAISNWLEVNEKDTTLTQKCFILGAETDKGIMSKIIFRISEYNTSFLKIEYKPMHLNEIMSYQIPLNGNNTLQLFSFNNTSTIETPSQWDLLFSTYTTTLFNNNEAVPYTVRGCLLNPKSLNAAVYTLDSLQPNKEEAFLNLSNSDISQLEYSNKHDAIGWNWKNYNFDNGLYEIDSLQIFILKPTNNEFYYKLKFLHYYNNNINGFPEFSYLKLY